MIEHPVIYKRDSSNNVRVWYMQQEDSRYRMVSGILNGQLIYSEWTEAKPKNIGRANSTTGEEQASSEINSKYTKQLKTGYKRKIEDIDKLDFFPPMLAKKVNDYASKLSFPAMVERKYNGARVIFNRNGAFSRKGEEWKTIPHIAQALKPILDKYPDIYIDGEAYNHDFRFNLNELMSILRKTKNIAESDLVRSKEIVKYYVYDCFNFDDVTISTSCIERREKAVSLFADIPYIVVVPYFVATSIDDMREFYNSFVEEGYEGAMYRTLSAPYSHSRSSNLLKIKPEDSSEGIILSIHEGTGNWYGAAKTATLNWNDIVFDSSFKGSYPELVNIYNNQEEWIGKKVTFLYNGLTGLGVPNFARIDIHNCFKE